MYNPTLGIVPKYVRGGQNEGSQPKLKGFRYF